MSDDVSREAATWLNNRSHRERREKRLFRVYNVYLFSSVQLTTCRKEKGAQWKPASRINLSFWHPHECLFLSRREIFLPRSVRARAEERIDRYDRPHLGRDFFSNYLRLWGWLQHLPLDRCNSSSRASLYPVHVFKGRFVVRARLRNLRQNRSSKVEGSLRATRWKLISRLINYRSAGRLAQRDVSVVKRRLATASAVFFERSKRVPDKVILTQTFLRD